VRTTGCLGGVGLPRVPWTAGTPGVTGENGLPLSLMVILGDRRKTPAPPLSQTCSKPAAATRIMVTEALCPRHHVRC
jgi:hypothetical protein